MVRPAPSFRIIQKTLRSAAIMSMVPDMVSPPAVRTSTWSFLQSFDQSGTGAGTRTDTAAAPRRT
jgi:hypothetical protein